ncbi:MAG TPA: hypothetical protein VFU43_05690 [Streptosporangiaceae bacterium]|nr:hypothetical protein [Streptosporangiaceae bacterium]
MSSKKQSSAKPRSQQRTGSGAQKQPSARQQRLSARERVAAARAEERRRERRRWLVTFGATGAVVAALGGGAAWAIVSNNNKTEQPASASGTGQPPWPLPADPIAGAKAAGLNVAPSEGNALHIHAHLDVFVNGKEVPVPANLGISRSGNELAELHTHDDTGVLHIESPSKDKRFTLGEVFSEWNVRLTPTQIGGLTTDAARTLTAYVDGKKQAGDPAAIQLTAHRQIALVFGDAATNAKVKVPSSYKFAEGE